MNTPFVRKLKQIHKAGQRAASLENEAYAQVKAYGDMVNSLLAYEGYYLRTYATLDNIPALKVPGNTLARMGRAVRKKRGLLNIWAVLNSASITKDNLHSIQAKSINVA